MSDATDFQLHDDEEATEQERLIHKTIMRVLGKDAYSGGCRTFYTQRQWEARGESYGSGAPIVVVHDGGDAARCFNYDYGDYKAIEKMDTALREIGCYAAPCTNWYTAIRAD